MDGSLAVLFLLAGLTDMGINHCGNEGCLARADARSEAALGYGDVIFQDKTIGRETYVTYAFGLTYGPFQPVIGASVTDSGDAWIGFGATYTANFAANRLYARMSLMPGYYSHGNGPDLGHDLEFRSGLELGYRANNGIKIGISYDHRSNAELASVNPGMETLQLRVSIPLN